MEGLNELNSINDLKELHNKFADQLPQHVGIILDGNRRWIRRQGVKDTMQGHIAGYQALKNILEPFFNAGVKFLSIYALSSENIAKRSPKEIKYLYKLMERGIGEVLKHSAVHEHEVKVNILGRIYELPPKIQEKIQKVIDSTADYSKRSVNVCINYDGQLELVDAMKKIAQKKIDPENITKQTIKDHIYSKNVPEVDYIIRTGMEDGARISGFLLWDASYAEFKFRNELWPEYNEKLLLEDLKEYITRNRRKGK